MEFSVSLSDALAAIALGLSGYATWKTLRFNERQKSLIESQEKLNILLLEQGENQALNALKADLGASFIKLGSSKYRLKVWNKGRAQARNVRIEFPEGSDVFIKSDIESKFPLEALDQYHAVELIAAVHMGSKRKHHIKLIWDDETGNDMHKSVYATI